MKKQDGKNIMAPYFLLFLGRMSFLSCRFIFADAKNGARSLIIYAGGYNIFFLLRFYFRPLIIFPPPLFLAK